SELEDAKRAAPLPDPLLREENGPAAFDDDRHRDGGKDRREDDERERGAGDVHHAPRSGVGAHHVQRIARTTMKTSAAATPITLPQVWARARNDSGERGWG